MRKEELNCLYDMNKDAGLVALGIKMPGGEIETIINPNVKAKMEYINNTYNDELVHPSNPNIRIERVEFFGYGTFSFGNAIDLLVHGKKMSRKNWNGKGQFVYYVPENDYDALTDAAKENAVDGKVHYNPYFALKTVNGAISTWIPSVTDILATDWYIVTTNAE